MRSVNSLKNSNIRSLGDLVRQTESQILQVKNFGKKSLQEIADLLEREGLELRHALRGDRPMVCASSTGARRRAGPRPTRPTTRTSKGDGPTCGTGKLGRQLRRTSEQRLALLRNLAISLIEHGAIETTEAKAKELRPFVEKLITKAEARHAARAAGWRCGTCTSAGPPTRCFRTSGRRSRRGRAATRASSRTGHRKGDGAEMARIEMIGIGRSDGTRAASRKKAPAPKKPPAAPRAKQSVPSATAANKGRGKTPSPATKQTRKAGDKGGSKG